MWENSYLRDFSAQVSQSLFLAYLTALPFIKLIELQSQKTRVSAVSGHKYHKSCFQLFWPFYGLLLQYDLKWQKIQISAVSVHKYHKSFF